MDKAYKRFRHVGFDKIVMDFGILAIAFNIGIMIAKGKKTKKKGNGAAYNNNLEKNISWIVAIFIVGKKKYAKNAKDMKKMEGTLFGHPH